MHAVDMAIGQKGLVEFRNGQKIWTVCVLKDGELFKIRLDMAKYHAVDVRGKVHPTDDSPHDVVKFDPTVKWLHAVQRFIPTEITLT